MDTNVITPGCDPMGTAIRDYYLNGKAGKLIVHSSDFEDDEIPVVDLFRTYEQMPELEQKALDEAAGRILDVGAGSGCHSLALKEMGKDCVAMEISQLSVDVMRERGLDARLVNLYDESFTEKFDTILMLMNSKQFFMAHLQRQVKGTVLIRLLKTHLHLFLAKLSLILTKLILNTLTQWICLHIKMVNRLILSVFSVSVAEELSLKAAHQQKSRLFII